MTRSARRQCGMSLRNLADLTGVSVGYLSTVENRQRPLDRSGLIASFAKARSYATAAHAQQSLEHGQTLMKERAA